MFNSLKYAKILEASGVPRNHAESHIQILSEVIGGEMVIKAEFESLKSEMKSEFRSMDQKFLTTDQKIAYEIQALESRLVLKLGGLMAGLLATGLTISKLFG